MKLSSPTFYRTNRPLEALLIEVSVARIAGCDTLVDASKIETKRQA